MYRKHFGLVDLPFRNTPDEDFFYSAAERKDIIEAIEYVISRRDAIIKVTGEVGSGKTTLLRILASRLKENGYHIVYVPTPRLSAEEMLKFIASDLGIKVAGTDSKAALYNKIYEYLVNAYSKNKGVVVLIDEAHTMPLDTFEEVRLLSNIETGKEKLITIVLFGQPELDDILEKEEMRQIRSRIAHGFLLKPLTAEQVFDYLNFRMRRAGYTGGNVFSLRIADKIHKLSDGLPREINNIADKLLMSAYSRGAAKVGKKDILLLAGNSTDDKSKWLWPVLLLILIFTALSFLIWRSGYLLSDPEGAGKSSGQALQLYGSGNDYGDINENNHGGDRNHDNSEVHAPGTTIANSESKLDTPQKGQDDRHDSSSQSGGYLPWDPNRLIVVLATVPCHEVDHTRKMLHSISDLIILQFDKNGSELCTFITGSFSKLRDAESYIDSLPDKIKNNYPYAIEVHKFNKMFRERNARIYEK